MGTNTMVYYTTSNDDVYLQDVLPYTTMVCMVWDTVGYRDGILLLNGMM